MTRRSVTVLVLASVLAVAVAAAVLANLSRRDRIDSARNAAGGTRVSQDALDRLRRVPFYRGLLRDDALRSASFTDTDAVRVDLDVRALVRPRLVGRDLETLSDLLPRNARGSVRVIVGRGAGGVVEGESWVFSGPAPLLDLLDRDPGEDSGVAWGAIPGSPSAVAAAWVNASRLADPEFGGAALATWRERADLAEKVLGRSLRGEIAEDLAGPVVVALYETRGHGGAEALVVIELKRSDRLRGLLDTIFALGVLTERGTIRRYREVPTGTFRTRAQGPGLALAVDGPVLLAATSRSLLEGALDARRERRPPDRLIARARAAHSSWNAVAASAFVSHGWARLARAADDPDAPTPIHGARLIPEGASSWRLEGEGPAPAITADPVLPFLRSVFGGPQGDAG